MLNLSLKPDAEQSLRRHEAFWNCAVLDRAPVAITLRKQNAPAVPEKTYDDDETRWLDVDFRAEQMAKQLEGHVYLGDAFPVAFPNLGPELFSSWCGCGYHFGKDTAWSDPCVFDLEKDEARIDFAHPLFKTLMRFTDNLLELGEGKFITGLTDFHPGGDHLAALRDPAVLCVDMLENVEWVDRALRDAEAQYFAAYGAFAARIRARGLPLTSWIPILHDGTYYIPSNDFSCMISTEMFEEHFLPGIRRECRFFDRSIYHLDGPNALRHLDSILAIPELDAIQWVPTSGTENFARWRKVYQRVQNAGKCVWFGVGLNELEDVIESLRPEGVFLSGVWGIRDEYEADAVMKRIAQWK